MASRKWGWRFSLCGLFVLAGALAVHGCRSFGASAEGARLERMKASPQWGDGRFENRLPESPIDLWGVLEARFSAEHTEPDAQIITVPRSKEDYASHPQSGLRVTWFGHSSFLVEIDGSRILVDPVWGLRASPFGWVGPKRFYPPILPIDELPKIDAVVISHDHYDHLDVTTVDFLKAHEVRWVVPLGVGAHLEYWGVASELITELDWWASTSLAAIEITCTPSRHFSGRGLTDRYKTLWAGWAFAGPRHRVFYSGDTALHPEFAEIGARLGPFDLTLIESGAYSPLWRDVHLGPEQAVIAHQLVQGRVMLPVHWGLFDLANHSWTEPIQRVRAAAKKAGVQLVVPRPGGWVEPTVRLHVDEWWDAEVPWKTAEEVPAFSTAVEDLIADPLALVETTTTSSAAGR